MLVNSLVLYDYFAPVLGIIMALSIWSGGGGVRSADHLSHLLLHFQHPTLFVSHVADAALTAQPFQILMTMPSVICRATLSLYLSVFVITLSFIFFFVFHALTLLLILICFAGGKRILQRSLYRMAVSLVVGIDIGLI